MPAPTRDPSLAGLPQRLGKYTLLRRLATGGMAELFLAIQRSVAGFEKLIVIKRILPSMTRDGAFVDMLLHEARLAATLSHPNLVQVFDLGMVDGAYFIAMEHVHGEDLRAIVRKLKSRGATDFPMEHALSIALGVCAGLGYAHEMRDLAGAPLNIVHRDVSPQNVVVTFNGDVKLVDFGIAKSDARACDDTESGRLKGKVPYMSPEQARGEAIDGRSDVFAAGVILFELTTGRRLFKAASEYETLKLICERDYPLPSRVHPDYPPALEAIVLRALAKDRSERWQSAREMQEALEEFVRQSRARASRTGLSQFMRSLFADKLASDDEALLHEKRLADSLAASGDRPTDAPVSLGPEGLESLRPATLGPATSATRTDAHAHGSARMTWIAGVALLAAAATAGGAAVTLRRGAAGDGARAVATAHGRGAIAVASSPPGAAVVINGEPRPQATPATFMNLAVGTPYVVTLTAPGYGPASQTITLTDDDPIGAVSLVLEPRRQP